MKAPLSSRGAVALALFGAQALAQPSSPVAGVQLSWVRGEGAHACPSASALEREVTARLGYSPFAGQPTQWIEGYVTADTERYAVRLFERDASGSTVGARALSANIGDCNELGEATSLALALIIDPNASLKALPQAVRASDSDAANGAASSPADASDAPGTVAVSNASDAPGTVAVSNASDASGTVAVSNASDASLPGSTQRRNGSGLGRSGTVMSPRSGVSDRAVCRDEPTNRSGIALLSGMRSGTFPELAFGVEFAAAGPLLRQIPLEYRVGMLFLPERAVAHGVAKIGYTLTAGHVSSCMQLHGSTDLRLLGCAGAELGAINTVVYDPEPTQPGDRLWLAARGDVAAQVHLWGPIRLEARAFVVVPITRWTFRAHVDGVAKELYEQRILEPSAVLGLGVQFP